MCTDYGQIERLQSDSRTVEQIVRLLEKYYEEANLERLVSTIKKGLRVSSDLFLRHRELLLSLHEQFPSLSGSDGMIGVHTEVMKVSVERLKEFGFPVYRVSLPLLLPNVRRRREDFNNAVTQSVKEAVRCFCVEKDVCLFDCATVIYLSYGGTIDNDNKEASVIQNGMIGYLLTDDAPSVCNSIYYYIRAEKDHHTEIYVVDSAHDIEVLQYIKGIISVTKN